MEFGWVRVTATARCPTAVVAKRDATGRDVADVGQLSGELAISALVALESSGGPPPALAAAMGIESMFLDADGGVAYLWWHGVRKRRHSCARADQ